jgi:Protein of unknown function (DUF1501)
MDAARTSAHSQIRCLLVRFPDAVPWNVRIMSISVRAALCSQRFGYGLGAAHCIRYGRIESECWCHGISKFCATRQTGHLSFPSGRPSHLDLFDYKPAMKGRFNQDTPPSIFGGQRVTGMVAQQDRFPVVPTMYGFKQGGKCGTWFSELLPHTSKIAD